MNASLRQLAMLGLLLLTWACTQQRATTGAQQASLISLIDTTGTDLDAQQAQQFIESNPDAVIMDVRTPEEYAAGHIKKSTNVNLYKAKFVQELAALDRSKTYVVHCAAGLPNGRSRKAVALMDSLGFKTIHHLNGGFNSWQQAGQPVVKNK